MALQLGDPARWILGCAQRAFDEGVSEYDFFKKFDVRVLVGYKRGDPSTMEALNEIHRNDVWPWR